MTLPTYKKAFLAAIATTALLTTAACGGSDSAGGSDTSSSSSPTSDPTDAATDGAATDDAATEGVTDGGYTAGTYEGSGSYSNPGGTSSVSVSVTLADDGTIEDVEVTPEASGTSRQYQDKFVSGIADEVAGKSIDEIDVSKVAGSSLTSQGFNDAIEQIKDEAQV